MERYEYDIVKTMELIDNDQKRDYANLYTSPSEGCSIFILKVMKI